MKAIRDIYSKQISDTLLHRTLMISDVETEAKEWMCQIQTGICKLAF